MTNSTERHREDADNQVAAIPEHQEARLLTAEELADIERFQQQRRKNPVPADTWLYVAEIDRLLMHIRLDREHLENEIFQDATDPSFALLPATPEQEYAAGVRFGQAVGYMARDQEASALSSRDAVNARPAVAANAPHVYEAFADEHGETCKTCGYTNSHLHVMDARELVSRWNAEREWQGVTSADQIRLAQRITAYANQRVAEALSKQKP